jgi:hypothetical protein
MNTNISLGFPKFVFMGSGLAGCASAPE